LAVFAHSNLVINLPDFDSSSFILQSGMWKKCEIGIKKKWKM